MANTRRPGYHVTEIPEPPIARFLFADTRMAWFWLIVRLYAAYEWLTASLEKLVGRDYTIGSTFNTAVRAVVGSSTVSFRWAPR